MIATARGSVRMTAFLMWTILLVPLYLLIYPIGRAWRRPFVGLWHRGVCYISGMKVNSHGVLLEGRELLLVGNHISYLDIPVLASCGDITFVAKSEVAGWPLFGFLAKIAQTVFIERNPKKALAQKHSLQKALVEHHRLMLFPEGTSSNGTRVLPYKSALFEMVMDPFVQENGYIQPVTLCYGNEESAWHGDMTLLPHLWQTFCRSHVQVEVIFHDAKPASAFENRKQVCDWSYGLSQEGLKRLRSHLSFEDQSEVVEETIVKV
jgi:lyso-ornithine lipid O-acyltransferase